MQEILNSDLPAAENMQLCNKALQKSKLFQQKLWRNQNELKKYLILLYCRKLERKLKPDSS